MPTRDVRGQPAAVRDTHDGRWVAHRVCGMGGRGLDLWGTREREGTVYVCVGGGAAVNATARTHAPAAATVLTTVSCCTNFSGAESVGAGG